MRLNYFADTFFFPFIDRALNHDAPSTFVSPTIDLSRDGRGSINARYQRFVPKLQDVIKTLAEVEHVMALKRY